MRFKYLCLTLAVITLILCVRFGFKSFSVQAESCPTPHEPVSNGPYPNSIFTYYLDGAADIVKPHMRTAFGIWNSQNFFRNCSFINFIEGSGPRPGIQGKYDIFVFTVDPLPSPAGPTAAAITTCNYDPNVCTGGNIGLVRCTIHYRTPPNLLSNNEGIFAATFATGANRIMVHEIGHVMGLTHQPDPQVPFFSVMNNGRGTNDAGSPVPPDPASNRGLIADEPTDCDHSAVRCVPCATPTPTPTPTPRTPGTCAAPPDFTTYPETGCVTGLRVRNGLCDRSDAFISRCVGPYDPNTCTCDMSPIVIDVSGNNINLTNENNGVLFDMDGDGTRERLSWTSAGSDDAWLALDRNGNGTIDTGAELFGNYTPQPEPLRGFVKNGFNALAEYDKPENGGNYDGRIDHDDYIFYSLRLWQDVNHNGTSEPAELRTLSETGVAILDLQYRESRRIDEHGNIFKYRARVKDVHGAQVGRWAWDVFLMRQP